MFTVRSWPRRRRRPALDDPVLPLPRDFFFHGADQFSIFLSGVSVHGMRALMGVGMALVVGAMWGARGAPFL
jgi:hypothetical protein